MEFSPDELIGIILQFRNPETVNNAREQMLQILRNPQSIEMLFQITFMPEIDNYIYQFAIISICQFCELNKEIITEEMLVVIRSNLMNVLRNFRESIPFSIILEAILTAAKLFQSDWPEIQEYAFEIDASKIIYHIKLLSMLIPFFSNETISEKTDFFIQLLSSVFQLDESNISKENIELQCSSVALASQLVQRTQSVELADNLRPLITKLLEIVICQTNFDSDLLNQILNPIYDIFNYQLRLIDTQYSTKIALSAMFDQSVPVEYKIQLNNLLEICLRDIDIQIPPELIRSILTLEFTLSVRLYQSEQEDLGFTWSYQIEDIVTYIYMHTTSHFIVNNVRNNFKQYCENPNEGIRFFQLLLLKVLSKCYDIPNSEDLLIELYPYLFNFLSDPSSRFRKFTAITLGFISARIKDYIIDNMSDILIKVNTFIAQYHDEAGIFLLLSLIKCANNTDDFIEVEYNFIKEFLCYPNSFICMDAISIIGYLILNSRSKYILISNDAYSTLMAAVTSDPSKYSGLLISLSHLITKDDDLSAHLPDFISLIKEGLNSEDNEIIYDSFIAVQNAINMFKEKSPEKTLFILNEMIAPIRKITSLPGDDNIVCQLKGQSIITLTIMLYASQINEEMLAFFFECVDHYLTIPNDILTYYLTKSCLHFLFLVNQKPLDYEAILNNEGIQNDMNQLINRVISSFSLIELADGSSDSIYIDFIKMAIKFFGFEKLKIESSAITKYLFAKLNYIKYCQDSHNSDKSFKKMIKSICEALLTVLISDSDKNSESIIIQLFSKYLVELLNDHLNPKGQIIAIHTFSLILNNEKSRSLFTKQSYDELIQQISNFIMGPNIIVATKSCKFFFDIISSHSDSDEISSTIVNSLRPFAPEIIKNLFQRLDSAQEQSNQSISLRETIVATICRFFEKFDDIISAEQLLNAILPCLPLTNKIKYSNIIYYIISAIQHIITKNIEMTKQLFRIYVLVISDRNKESNYIDETVLFLMANFINQFSSLFQSEEEENEVIASIFQGDEIAYKSFINFYMKYLLNYQQMVTPPQGIDVQVIDLTNQ